MELALTPEVQVRIERRLQDGRWQSPSQMIGTALDLLDDMEDLVLLSREELDAKLEESLAQAERGETYSPGEVRERLAGVLASR